jgi:hypothetical protein
MTDEIAEAVKLADKCIELEPVRLGHIERCRQEEAINSMRLAGKEAVRDTAILARAVLALSERCERLEALTTRAADSIESCARRHGSATGSIAADELRNAIASTRTTKDGE